MQPMLAGTLKKPETLRFPVMVSPKLDGFRAVVINGVLLSRNMKPIPNVHVQRMLGTKLFNGLDGELICGEPTARDAFRNTSSAVTRAEGEPDVKFYVFDDFDAAHLPFEDRWTCLYKIKSPHVIVVAHRYVNNQEELADFEEQCLEAGYEGVMIRDPQGPYKQGRSTEREGYLLKLKRFEDAEARITGSEERQHNGNDKDASGKRTTHKAGKTGLGTLGAVNVVGINGDYAEVEFDIGTGFDDATRAELWKDRSKLIGRVVKFKYFPSGSKDKPRFPVFLGFRDSIDLQK